MLGAPELNAVLQVGSHERGVEGESHLPRPAGHTAFNAAWDVIYTVPKAGGQRSAQVAPQLHAGRIIQVLGSALDKDCGEQGHAIGQSLMCSHPVASSSRTCSSAGLLEREQEYCNPGTRSEKGIACPYSRMFFFKEMVLSWRQV